MDNQQEQGVPFAYAFYSKTLHRDRPSSTYAFGCSRWSSVTGAHLAMSQTANILNQGRDINLVEAEIINQFPDAVYRGIFTTENYLWVMSGHIITQQLPVAGPHIVLSDFVNGPIQRLEVPKARAARAGIIRLIVNNDAATLTPK